ncbi:hypothetical protein AAFF_G00391440 [Aldrovandia affinis]|uniref:Uncharacterized protein n=1 Tax=Aldrovandia affinis TaxID=143900 RepID=A0AAD7SDW6_9TELE|nr:hypothetical protein AAFF_G00391440 [Aldrovandia affinis]
MLHGLAPPPLIKRCFPSARSATHAAVTADCVPVCAALWPPRSHAARVCTPAFESGGRAVILKSGLVKTCVCTRDTLARWLPAAAARGPATADAMGPPELPARYGSWSPAIFPRHVAGAGPFATFGSAAIARQLPGTRVCIVARSQNEESSPVCEKDQKRAK